MLPIPLPNSDDDVARRSVDTNEGEVGGDNGIDAQRDRRLLVWNHRWEYDKAPEIFAEALSILKHSGVDFRLALLGARPRVVPEALQQIEQTCADNIIVSKKVDRERYRRIVSQASIPSYTCCIITLFISYIGL